MTKISEFMEHHYPHFHSATLVEAAADAAIVAPLIFARVLGW